MYTRNVNHDREDIKIYETKYEKHLLYAMWNNINLKILNVMLFITKVILVFFFFFIIFTENKNVSKNDWSCTFAGEEKGNQPLDSNCVALVSKVNINFSLKLVNLFQKSDLNFAFSPVSLLSILKPMFSLLGDKKVGHFIKSFMTSENGMNECFTKTSRNSTRDKFNNVNKIWLDDALKISVNDSLLNEIIKRISIHSHEREAAMTINNWIKEMTKGGITHLIREDSLNEDTRIIVTNGVYFNGQWKFPFSKILTRPYEFELKRNRKTEIPMMANTLRTKFYLATSIKMLELPYEENNFVMNIFIADELSYAQISEALNKSTFGKIKILIPKFTLESKNNMALYFGKLGLGKLFNSSINYIEPESRFSDLIHKVKIVVSEEGTEASAGTAAISGRSVTPMFKVDRPFYFMIRDLKEGLIFFFGKIVNPSNEK